MNRKKMALIFLVCVLVLGAGYFLFFNGNIGAQDQAKKDDPSLTQTGDVSVSIVKIEASNVMDGLIAPSTTFTLETSEPVSSEYLEANLIVEPQMDYRLDSIAENTYKITPKEDLPRGLVLAFKYHQPDRVAGWAFQVSSDLTLTSIYPRDGADQVPTNTTIEMTFNYPIDEGIVERIRIEPEVAFKHQVIDNKLILMPEGLEEEARYYVSIEPGYVNQMGSEQKREIYSDFSTIAPRESFDYYQINTSLFSNDTNPLISAGYYSPEEGRAKIYRLEDVDALIEIREDLNKLSKFYLYPHKKMDLRVLNLVYDDSISVDEQNYSTAFVLPQLQDGYYMAIVESNQGTYIEFLQVSPYRVYYEQGDDHLLVWILDGASGEVVADAPILGDNKPLGITDQDGIAVLTDFSDAQRIKLKLPTIDLVLPLVYKSYQTTTVDPVDQANQPPLQDKSLYKSFLYTDRPVYRKTDTIDVFGMLSYHDKRKVPKIEVFLMSRGEIVDQKEVEVSEYGTYRASFNIVDSPYDYFNIASYIDDRELDWQTVEIAAYHKPEFFMDVAVDKSVLGPSDTVTLEGDVRYYDETPAVNMTLDVSGDTYSYLYFSESYGRVITSDVGHFETTITPRIPYKKSDPISLYLNITNKEAETTDVSNRKVVQLFPTNLILEADIETRAGSDLLTGTIKTHNLKLPKEILGGEDPSLYRGAPLDTSVEIALVESYYEPIETGEQYNPFLKVMEKTYRYEQRESLVYSATETTHQGTFSFDYAYIPQRSYKLVVTAIDTKNVTLTDEAYFYGKDISPWDTAPKMPKLDFSYTVDLDKDFRISLQMPQTSDATDLEASEPVGSAGSDESAGPAGPTGPAESAENSESKIGETGFVLKPEAKTLFIKYQGTYQNHKVTRDHSFEGNFNEKDIPNFILKAIFFDGVNFQVDDSQNVAYVSMNDADKALDIAISTDKSVYKPGDQMTVAVKTTFKGKPVDAQVYVNVVDEAYYALYSDSALAFNDFYATIYETGIRYSYYTNYTNRDSMAEYGDGGGDGYYVREDFKDSAYVGIATTNGDGEGRVTFELPDNITSWRITTHGISKNLAIGTQKVNRVSKLPFYGRLIMADMYLDGEAPALILRAGGSEINNETLVNYKVVYKNASGDDKTFIVQGLPRAYTAIQLPKLALGDHSLTVYADQGSYKDAIVHTFEVVASRMAIPVVLRETVSQDFKLMNPRGLTTLRFLHQEAAELEQALHSLTGLPGERLEWLLSRLEVDRLLTPLDLQGNQREPRRDLVYSFYHHDGLVSPLINAEGDLDLTLDVLAIAPGYLEDLLYQFRYHLDGLMENPENSLITRLKGLLGYAYLKSPVLYDLHQAEALVNTTVKDQETLDEAKIILARAYATFGALEEAYRIYSDFNLPSQMDQTDLTRERAFQIAIIGNILGVESAKEWYAWATYSLPRAHVFQLKQLQYLRLDSARVEPIKVVYKLNDKTSELILKDTWPTQLLLKPGDDIEILALSAEGKAGSGQTQVTVLQTYEGNLSNTVMEQLEGYQVQCQVSTSTVALSEHIEITYKITHPEKRSFTLYQPIPSGFTVYKSEGTESNGQLVLSHYSASTSSTIKVVLKAKQKGDFILEPGVITENHEKHLKTDAIKLTVN